jgi:CRISPR-associated protein Cmr2
MSRETALLTFGIGPVHTFIAQARRVSDVWSGSYLLSHLIRQAIGFVRNQDGCEMVFPYLKPDEHIPDGLPNRFVCRVPAEEAGNIAREMKSRVLDAWRIVVDEALHDLSHGLKPPEEMKTRQMRSLLDFSWSWVPESEGYPAASIEGARLYSAARHFRPFSQISEAGEKCAICGERTALPNGDRSKVRSAWLEAEAEAKADPESKLARFLREDQGRLCLVCAAKRFFPLRQEQKPNFRAFDEFPPSKDAPYFAMVKMDGDRMGRILSLGPEEVRGGDLEGFHREVSNALTEFANGLRTTKSADLNLKGVDHPPLRREDRPPQLIYSGGDDVLFVCDPRDALALVRGIRQRYLAAFAKARPYLRSEEEPFTISAAILFAHPSHPAGLLFHEVEDTLKYVAKARAGRDAVALRLIKRGGVPVEVAFQWSDPGAPEVESWMDLLEKVAGLLRSGELSSRQTFTLRLEEGILGDVFKKDSDRWSRWLTERLSRNEGMAGQAEELGSLVAPFFVHDHAAALRIARFLGREVER